MAKATEKQMEYAKFISDTLEINLPETNDKFVIGAFISKNKEAAAIRQDEMNQAIYSKIKSEIKIVDVAKEMGMTITRKGSYFSTREYDSLRINPERNLYFRNSRGHSGTVIDFVMEFSGKDRNDVIRELSKRIDGYENQMVIQPVISEQVKVKKPVEFVLPKKGDNMRNVFAYLTISRSLDPDILQEMVDRKYIYQDEKRNCVFVSYKETLPVFATMVGTNTFAPFKGDVEGSDELHTWYVSNGQSKLYIAESPIDAISKMSILKGAAHNYKEFDYLALTGTGKYQAVFEHLKRGQYNEIYIGTDNDEAGTICLNNIKAGVREKFSEIKVIVDRPLLTVDWNDELKYLISKGYRFDNYISPTHAKEMVQNEIEAILIGDKQQEEFFKSYIKKWGYPDELQDYVADYLFHYKDKALKDLDEGSMESAEKIVHNYNKQMKLEMRSMEKMHECEIIKATLKKSKISKTYITYEEKGFNEGIETALKKIIDAYKKGMSYEEIQKLLQVERIHRKDTKYNIGYEKAHKLAADKMREIQMNRSRHILINTEKEL